MEPLGEAATGTFVLVPIRGVRLTVARAWDLAGRLEADRDVARAEPALVLPGHDPLPEQVLPPGRIRARSLDFVGDLKCSYG